MPNLESFVDQAQADSASISNASETSRAHDKQAEEYINNSPDIYNEASSEYIEQTSQKAKEALDQGNYQEATKLFKQLASHQEGLSSITEKAAGNPESREIEKLKGKLREMGEKNWDKAVEVVENFLQSSGHSSFDTFALYDGIDLLAQLKKFDPEKFSREAMNLVDKLNTREIANQMELIPPLPALHLLVCLKDLREDLYKEVKNSMAYHYKNFLESVQFRIEMPTRLSPAARAYSLEELGNIEPKEFENSQKQARRYIGHQASLDTIDMDLPIEKISAKKYGLIDAPLADILSEVSGDLSSSFEGLNQDFSFRKQIVPNFETINLALALSESSESSEYTPEQQAEYDQIKESTDNLLKKLLLADDRIKSTQNEIDEIMDSLNDNKILSQNRVDEVMRSGKDSISAMVRKINKPKAIRANEALIQQTRSLMDLINNKAPLNQIKKSFESLGANNG